MHQPFEPELSQASLEASNAALSNAIAIKDATLYQSQSCNGCHGDNGVGTAAGPKVAGVHGRFTSEQLTAMLKVASAKMLAGGMTPSERAPAYMVAMVAYLESLK